MFPYANPMTWNHGGLMRRHIETADHLLWTVIFRTMKITLVMAQQSEMNVYSFSVCMKEFLISTKHVTNRHINCTLNTTQ